MGVVLFILFIGLLSLTLLLVLFSLFIGLLSLTLLLVLFSLFIGLLLFWQPIPESILPPGPGLSQRGQLNPLGQWQLPALLHIYKRITFLRNKQQLLNRCGSFLFFSTSPFSFCLNFYITPLVGKAYYTKK